MSAVYKVSTSPKRHVSNALRGNVFAKSLLYMDVPGEESFRKHLLVTAHFVPRVSQTLTSQNFAKGVWPLPTDFSCFLSWLKPKLTFRGLSHKSYWPSISRLRLWILCHMGNIAGSSSRGLRIKMEACNIRQKAGKPGRRPNEKCITFALFSSTWKSESMTESIVQNDSVVFPGKIPHY